MWVTKSLVAVSHEWNVHATEHMKFAAPREYKKNATRNSMVKIACCCCCCAAFSAIHWLCSGFGEIPAAQLSPTANAKKSPTILKVKLCSISSSNGSISTRRQITSARRQEKLHRVISARVRLPIVQSETVHNNNLLRCFPLSWAFSCKHVDSAVRSSARIMMSERRKLVCAKKAAQRTHQDLAAIKSQ